MITTSGVLAMLAATSAASCDRMVDGLNAMHTVVSIELGEAVIVTGLVMSGKLAPTLKPLFTPDITVMNPITTLTLKMSESNA
jgi:hypothetical protein